MGAESRIMLYTPPTGEELERQTRNRNARNLYNKYTEEELKNWLKVDLYEAIDLENFKGQNIPEYMIDYCVKRKLPIYHPVKCQGRQEAFLIIKKAQEVLKVHSKRKVYDSAFLDESLPEDRDYSPEEFFSVFSEAFARNGIFSETLPVPELAGDIETFYTFWKNFRSNRIFDNPEDIFNQSGSNRRYNMAKNKEVNSKKKTQDMLRIHELVKLALQKDPRIKRTKPVELEWKEEEIKSLKRLNTLLSKSKTKIADITKKMNDLFVTKRAASEIKSKLEAISKK